MKLDINARKLNPSIHWAVWSILIAAALNLILAFVTGSVIDGLLNLLACLACLVGLVGIAQKID